MVVTTDLFGAGNVYPWLMLLIHPWSPEQNSDSHPPGCFFFTRDFIVLFLDSDRQRRQPPGLATHGTCLRAVDRDLGCMLGAGNRGRRMYENPHRARQPWQYRGSRHGPLWRADPAGG